MMDFKHTRIKNNVDLQNLDNEAKILDIDCKINEEIIDSLVDIENVMQINLKSENKYISKMENDTNQSPKYNEFNLDVENIKEYLKISDEPKPKVELDYEKFIEDLKNEKFNSMLPLYLYRPTSKKFVIEYKTEITSRFQNDIELILKKLDVAKIAVTGEIDRAYSVVSKLNDGDKLIAVSSKDSNHEYFLLPDLDLHDKAPKVVLIGLEEFKYTTNNLLGTEVILCFYDELEYSNYFNSLIKEFKQKTTFDYIKEDKLYYNQNMQVLALINLIEKYGQIDIYNIKNNELIFIKKISKYTKEYEKFVLRYMLYLKFELPMDLKTEYFI